MSKLPVQGCIGNHDVPLGDKSDTFLECWPYPYEADHYWSFDYGPVHVAVIDQFTDEMWSAPPDSSARQIEWLRRDLRENERPWTIVLLHIPIREDHTYGGGWDARLVATRLLSALQHEEVDLLVCGHEHVHAFGETGGIPQLTMGSASDRDGTPSFYIYNVSATTLTVTAYSPQGTAIDVVSVER